MYLGTLTALTSFLGGEASEKNDVKAVSVLTFSHDSRTSTFWTRFASSKSGRTRESCLFDSDRRRVVLSNTRPSASCLPKRRRRSKSHIQKRTFWLKRTKEFCGRLRLPQNYLAFSQNGLTLPLTWLCFYVLIPKYNFWATSIGIEFSIRGLRPLSRAPSARYAAGCARGLGACGALD